MSVRCIFDKFTGELIEYNTQRAPNENEIVGYWSISNPKHGLIYDTATNTIREQTESDSPVEHRICTVYPISQLIKPKLKTKVLFTSDNNTPFIDNASTIHLAAGSWSIQGTLTLNGLHSVRYCTVIWTVNGNDIYKKTFGGLVFHHSGWYSIEFSRIIKLDNASQLELWLECDKFIKINQSPIINHITIHYIGVTV